MTCTIMPLVNVLGVSAQPEIPFTMIVLGSAWAIERRRFLLAGLLIVAACTLRYEIWAAPIGLWAYAAICFRRNARSYARGLALAGAIPASGICAWIVFCRLSDGNWLQFVGHTRAFAVWFRSQLPYPVWVQTVVFPSPPGALWRRSQRSALAGRFVQASSCPCRYWRFSSSHTPEVAGSRCPATSLC